MSPWIIVSPIGLRWAEKYLTEDSAWSKLLNAFHLPRTAQNKANMKAKGWVVRQVDTG